MSNQGYYDQPQQGNNPYSSADPQNQQQQAPQQDYTAPPGPPPGQAPRRTGTFEESAFVPENERGEQREAMEQFEMNKSGNESQTDKDVAQLQREYPGVDGSLIAAIYGDSGMGAARETLQELANQNQAGQ